MECMKRLGTLALVAYGLCMTFPAAAVGMENTPVSQEIEPRVAQIVLRAVKAEVEAHPELADSVGEEALLRGVARAVAEHPGDADVIGAVAHRLKPHLAGEIDALTLMHPASIKASAKPVPEWAPANYKTTAAPPIAASKREQDVAELDLEDLIEARVVTASKSKERAFDAPGAITVISNEDLRRSGHTTVMEALRMVPGLQVAQISSSSWSISSRGFGDEYANKLLVMIDGRSIYTRTFSGVFWDQVNLPLEDVDRIEVIRGPGATLWGANAVNGVINIVTKESKYTQGAYLTGGGGNYERASAEGRVGGKLGNYGHYRLYSRHVERERTEGRDGRDRHNGWWRTLTGFRADWENSSNDAFTLHGEVQRGGNEQETIQSGINDDTQTTNAYLRGRWGKILENGSQLNASSYIDHDYRDSASIEMRVTNVDVDVNHTLRWMGRNELVWGGGYRATLDEYGSRNVLSFVPDSDRQHLFSAFVQNKFEATRNLDLILGSKLERNDYTGMEVQPTAKFSYRPDGRSTLWGSVARAVRTPSRAEDSIQLLLYPVPGTPAIARAYGNHGIGSEEMFAYELGYRVSPADGLIFDIAGYYNHYDDLSGLSFDTPFNDNGTMIVPLRVSNVGQGEVYGIETSATWQVNPQWRLAGYYTFSRMFTDTPATSTLFLGYEDLWPQHTFSIRSYYNIRDDLELDAALYYVSSLDDALNVDISTPRPVDSYLRGDVRLGWRPVDGLEFSFAGLNLIEGEHTEFVDSRFYEATRIGRSYYGKVSWRF